VNELIALLVFASIGFITGISSGLLGIGGGVIFIPALYILLPVLGCQQENLTYIVVATSLFAGSFASGGSFYNHFKSKNLSFEKGAYLAAGSIISAILIPNIIVEINQEFIKYFICVLLIFALLSIQKRNTDKLSGNYIFPSWLLFITGILIGAIASLSGTGGGVLFFPILFNFTHLDTKKAIGTSSMAVALTMIIATISFSFTSHHETGAYQFGLTNYFAGIPMGIAAFIGSKYGVRLNFKLPVFVIKRIFSVFLLLAILKILFG
jgi:hypothetical protein